MGSGWGGMSIASLTLDSVFRLQNTLLPTDPRQVVLKRLIELQADGPISRMLWCRFQTLPSIYRPSTWPTNELELYGVHRLEPLRQHTSYGTFDQAGASIELRQ